MIKSCRKWKRKEYQKKKNSPGISRGVFFNLKSHLAFQGLQLAQMLLFLPDNLLQHFPVLVSQLIFLNKYGIKPDRLMLQGHYLLPAPP